MRFVRATMCAVCAFTLGACAGGGGGAGEPQGERELRLAPERVFDAERSFMRGSPVGIELHWWLAQDSKGDIARALARYDLDTPFLPASTRERLRLSGLRVVAVPLSEVFVIHQIAPPRSNWSRRWLGQETEWVQLVRSRSISGGTRSVAYGGEQRLPEGVLRLVGRGWVQPRPTEADGEMRIDAVMHMQFAAQIQRREQEGDRRNLFRPAPVAALTPLEDMGPFIEDLGLQLSVPVGYAIVLTTDFPESDWSAVEAVTRENLIEELERRESVPADASDAVAADEQARFGPVPTAPMDVESDSSDESVQVFDTLDAPMPSLEEAFGPPAAPVPTVGQLLLETRDSLSRPMRGVVILIPRLPERFELLP